MTGLTTDFIDLLCCLVDGEVDFLVVGGYAVAYYGYPRATKDIDIFVRADHENAAKLYKALAEFGAPLTEFDVVEEDFSDYGGVLQLGVPPQRIDILNRISGVTYTEATVGAKLFKVLGRDICIIGIEALIKNKLAAGRDQDLVDAKKLKQFRK